MTVGMSDMGMSELGMSETTQLYFCVCYYKACTTYDLSVVKCIRKICVSECFRQFSQVSLLFYAVFVDIFGVRGNFMQS